MNTGTCDVMQILFLIGCFFSFVQALLAEVAKQQFVCNAKGWMLKRGDAKFPKIPWTVGWYVFPKDTTLKSLHLSHRHREPAHLQTHDNQWEILLNRTGLIHLRHHNTM